MSVVNLKKETCRCVTVGVLSFWVLTCFLSAVTCHANDHRLRELERAFREVRSFSNARALLIEAERVERFQLGVETLFSLLAEFPDTSEGDQEIQRIQARLGLYRGNPPRLRSHLVLSHSEFLIQLQFSASDTDRIVADLFAPLSHWTYPFLMERIRTGQSSHEDRTNSEQQLQEIRSRISGELSNELETVSNRLDLPFVDDRVTRTYLEILDLRERVPESFEYGDEEEMAKLLRKMQPSVVLPRLEALWDQRIRQTVDQGNPGFVPRILGQVHHPWVDGYLERVAIDKTRNIFTRFYAFRELVVRRELYKGSWIGYFGEIADEVMRVDSKKLMWDFTYVLSLLYEQLILKLPRDSHLVTHLKQAVHRGLITVNRSKQIVVRTGKFDPPLQVDREEVAEFLERTDDLWSAREKAKWQKFLDRMQSCGGMLS